MTEIDKQRRCIQSNIESLTRYAQLSDTSAATVIDQLTYNYKAGSNRLLSVSDASANAKGFIDGATLSTEYTYDQDGNLTQDENKAIDITYNILSKTATVARRPSPAIVPRLLIPIAPPGSAYVSAW
ncbi:hypothetical protein AB9P05_05425 [Roseivirga sp. BDSF3-8]|uniref:hypothetical protein n=1 Tax=Roseivirga sp. BDSF3-8 TaxID=3241598 RepID=UPI003532340B